MSSNQAKPEHKSQTKTSYKKTALVRSRDSRGRFISTKPDAQRVTRSAARQATTPVARQIAKSASRQVDIPPKLKLLPPNVRTRIYEYTLTTKTQLTLYAYPLPDIQGPYLMITEKGEDNKRGKVFNQLKFVNKFFFKETRDLELKWNYILFRCKETEANKLYNCLLALEMRGELSWPQRIVVSPAYWHEQRIPMPLDCFHMCVCAFDTVCLLYPGVNFAFYYNMNPRPYVVDEYYIIVLICEAIYFRYHLYNKFYNGPDLGPSIVRFVERHLNNWMASCIPEGCFTGHHVALRAQNVRYLFDAPELTTEKFLAAFGTEAPSDQEPERWARSMVAWIKDEP
ncbi:unnamed protein product [Periconia digitata]|uniref:Uncharacterized protein n=1 Tax=Periconia digitata TaxID=1303443 RepID=A0A9W4XPU1_9PLEO|nr:unnamed protein product [Periconia digitata]